MEAKWEWKIKRLWLSGSNTSMKWGKKLSLRRNSSSFMELPLLQVGHKQHPPERPFWNHHMILARLG